MSDTYNDASGQPRPYPGSRDWVPPKEDEEWTFEGDALAGPSWVDPGWAGYAEGPCLQVPMGDLWGKGPYHTKPARVGDTIRFVAAKGSKVAHFVVVEGEPDEKQGTLKPAQQSAAALEDMLKTGHITADELGEDAKAQVSARSPELKQVVAGEATLAEKVEPMVIARSA